MLSLWMVSDPGWYIFLQIGLNFLVAAPTYHLDPVKRLILH